MSDQRPGQSATPERRSRYDEVEGGVSPSPFISIIVAVAFVSAFGAAAIGESMGQTGPQLWILAGLTATIAEVMAAFAPAEG